MEKRKITLNLQNHKKLKDMSQLRKMTQSAYVDYLVTKDHKKHV